MNEPMEAFRLHLHDGTTRLAEGHGIFDACHRLGWGSGDIQDRLKFAEELGVLPRLAPQEGA
jgi:hypothetical protein